MAPFHVGIFETQKQKKIIKWTMFITEESFS